MNELALFAGAGGCILGGRLLGWRTRCAVEINPYCRKVLLARQRDGMLDRFPIWDDVCTFDGKPWRGKIDVISGGFPCQDISSAGNGAGIGGSRSGLWKEMARIIGEVQPTYVLVENSPMLFSRGLDVVLADLAALGFNAEWGVIGACDAGAVHKRDRIWIVAYSNIKYERVIYRGAIEKRRNMGNHSQTGSPIDRYIQELGEQGKQCECERKDILPPYICRMDDEMAYGLDRLKAIGNGQVPAVVKLAWETLTSIGAEPGCSYAEKVGIK